METELEKVKKMPVKSAAQFRFMHAMANGDKKKGKGIGPSEDVARDFLAKTSDDKKSRFAKSLKKHKK